MRSAFPTTAALTRKGKKSGGATVPMRCGAFSNIISSHVYDRTSQRDGVIVRFRICGAERSQELSARLAPEFCARLRATFPNHALIQGTIDDLKSDEPWDAILSINVLEHIAKDERELA